VLDYEFAELVAVVVDYFVLKPEDALDDFVGVGVRTQTFREGVGL
jgi:hypothetical protein